MSDGIDIAAKKEEIQNFLVNALINAYESKDVDYFETKKISTYILKNIQRVASQQELLVFLKNLVDQWNIFESILKAEEKKATNPEEAQLVAKLSDYIKSFNKISPHV